MSLRSANRLTSRNRSAGSTVTFNSESACCTRCVSRDWYDCDDLGRPLGDLRRGARSICRPLWARSAASATPSSARIFVVAASALRITGSIAGQSSRGSWSARGCSSTDARQRQQHPQVDRLRPARCGRRNASSCRR